MFMDGKWWGTDNKAWAVKDAQEGTLISTDEAIVLSEDDFYDFLCTKEQLQKLAEADARAIARYLQVGRTDTGEVLAPLSNYKVKICHIKRNGTAKRFRRTYYTSK